MNALSMLFAALLLGFGAANARADEVCSGAEGNECEAAQDIVDMVDDNPIVDATDAPEEATEAIESQDDYTGSGTDDSE